MTYKLHGGYKNMFSIKEQLNAEEPMQFFLAKLRWFFGRKKFNYQVILHWINGNNIISKKVLV